MNGEPEDTIAAEGCNHAHERRSGSHAPSKSNPEVAPKGVAHRKAVVAELARLDASHNPVGNPRRDECLQFVGDKTDRIKRRPLVEIEELWNDPVSQEAESHENACENEQAPTGAQATGVEEDF